MDKNVEEVPVQRGDIAEKIRALDAQIEKLDALIEKNKAAMDQNNAQLTLKIAELCKRAIFSK